MSVGDTSAVRKTADISVCGIYRYRLTRTWEETLPVLFWIMLNPSTADADVDDPTVRRCVGFARSFGCGGIDVRNLFAYRATDPSQLLLVKDPVGPDNDPHHIMALATRCKSGPVVAAWGTKGSLLDRAERVLYLLKNWGVALHCLGKTKDGHPKHPLYLSAESTLLEFP